MEGHIQFILAGLDGTVLCMHGIYLTRCAHYNHLQYRYPWVEIIQRLIGVYIMSAQWWPMMQAWQKMAQSPLNDAIQPVDSQEEGQSLTTDRRWVTENEMAAPGLIDAASLESDKWHRPRSNGLGRSFLSKLMWTKNIVCFVVSVSNELWLSQLIETYTCL